MVCINFLSLLDSALVIPLGFIHFFSSVVQFTGVQLSVIVSWDALYFIGCLGIIVMSSFSFMILVNWVCLVLVSLAKDICSDFSSNYIGASDHYPCFIKKLKLENGMKMQIGVERRD